MHELAVRIMLVVGAALFIGARRALGFILRISLPIDHPFRVFQESVYQRFDDEFVRAAFLSSAPRRPAGGTPARRRLVAVAALSVNTLGLILMPALF